jgi:branched-chain amino acid transport system permease protein
VRKLAAVWVGLVLAILATFLSGTVASASTASPSPTDAASSPASSPAASPGASEQPAQGVRVFVREGREGIPGAKVTVSQGDKEIATGETDDRGAAVIGVPAAGQYTVTVDTASLGGKKLESDKITREVRADEIAPVAFRVGTPAAPGENGASGGGIELSLVSQLVVQGLRFGLIIALAAIGLSLIFGTTGLTNFAHGELVTFGAVAAYFFNVTIGLPLLVAAPLAVIVGGAFGWAQDRGLWGPLRNRNTGLIAMMIVSIGLALLLRYLILFRFGGTTKSYADYQGQAGMAIGPVLLRPIDMISMGVAVVVLLLVSFALLKTKLGKATRAVADNPALAAATGIDVDRVIRSVWISGAALAALAGVLLGLVQGINWQMGLQILLLVFAAVILGGLGTAFGALAGGIVVGLFIEVSTLWVPTELKNVGALAVLIIILLVRPQGLLGRRERIG